MSARRAVLVAAALAVAGAALLGVMAGGQGEAADVTRGPDTLKPSNVGFGLVTSYDGPTSRGFGLAHDGTNLWYFAKTGFSSSEIFKLDPADGTVLDSFPNPGAQLGLGLAHDGTYLYVTDSNFGTQTETIFVVDPSDGSVVTSFADPASPSGSTTGLAFLAGSLFAIDDLTEVITELDPADGTVLNSFPIAVTGVFGGLASDGANLVTYENLSDEYLVVDPTDGSIIDSFFLPAQVASFSVVRGLAFDGGTLFALELAGTLTPAGIAVFSDQAPKLPTRTPSLTPSPTATGQFGLSGKWNIKFNGFVTQFFSAQVTESGTDLTIDLGFGDAQLTGGIDKATRDFGVFGCVGDCGGLSMQGTVSPDGNSMSGTFDSGLGLSGSFTGAKKGVAPATATPTPTATPTATPTVPAPVGGIARDPELGTLALETVDSSGRGTGVLAGIAAGVAAFVAVGAAAAYARRRLAR